MDHSLLNQSATEERLGCSQFGAITNKTATLEYRFLCDTKFSFHLDKWPRVRSLGGVVVGVSFFFFKKVPQCFPG